MAKIGFWLKGATGKLAGAALQRGANGETIMREIVTPKNPQTEAQMIQRILMNTASQAYSKMKDICDHSFEGTTAGAQTMSLFMSRNANMLRQKLAAEVEAGYDLGSVYAFSPLGQKYLCPNEYIISEGSLPALQYKLDEENSTHALLVTASTGTYRAIIDAYGLRRGDQLTFIAVTGNSPATSTFHFARVILDPVNADGTQASLDVPFYNGNAVNLPNPRNEGSMQVGWNGDEEAIYFAFNLKAITMCAVIVSRKNNESWLRSPASFVSDPERVAGFFPSMQECLDATQNGGVNVVNSRYLNNSGQGTVIDPYASVALSMKTAGGETVDVVGTGSAVKGGVTFLTVKDSGGNSYFIKNGDSHSATYNKWNKSKNALGAAAWDTISEDAPTDAQTVKVSAYTQEGDMWNNWQALQSLGWDYAIFMATA